MPQHACCCPERPSQTLVCCAARGCCPAYTFSHMRSRLLQIVTHRGAPAENTAAKEELEATLGQGLV